MADTKQNEGDFSPLLVTRGDTWRVNLREDFPQLGDGWLVISVCKPDTPTIVWKFSIPYEHWSSEMDPLVFPGKRIIINGEMHYDIKHMMHLPDFKPENLGKRPVGYVRPPRPAVHVTDAIVQVTRLLATGDVREDGKPQFNYWFAIKDGDIDVKAKIDKASREERAGAETMSMLKPGQWFKIGYNRRIEVESFFDAETAGESDIPW